MIFRSISKLALICTTLVLATTSGTAIAVDYAALYARNSASVVTVKTQTLAISRAGIAVKPGVGTGFLIESDVVMTAAHVVDGVDMVRVRFNDDTYIAADVMASVQDSDVALLKLKTPRANAVIAQLGDSTEVDTGSPVFIIGAPYGIEQTLSVGILSGRMQKGEAADGSPIEFLQTDTAINPGNSGGPMFNQQGEVVGVVSFILTKSGGFDGIGFASAITPAYQALKLSSEYIAGFDGHKLSSRQKRALSVPGEGVLIQRIVSGSIADQLGLKAGTIPARIAGTDLLLGGDVVLDISCDSCKNSDQKIAVDYMANKFFKEQTLSVKVFRDGQMVDLTKELATDDIDGVAGQVAELSMLSAR